MSATDNVQLGGGTPIVAYWIAAAPFPELAWYVKLSVPVKSAFGVYCTWPVA